MNKEGSAIVRSDPPSVIRVDTNTTVVKLWRNEALALIKELAREAEAFEPVYLIIEKDEIYKKEYVDD